MLKVWVTNKRDRSQFEHAVGPLVFGREPRTAGMRCVVQDPFVSRDQLRVEELSGGRIRLDNLSQTNALALADGSKVAIGERRELTLPIRLTVGETLIDLALAPPPESESETTGPLLTVSVPLRGSERRIRNTLAGLGDSPGAETLARWFETVFAIQRSAASSGEFYQQTARALVDLVGLDTGLVLLREGEGWEVMARQPPDEGEGPEFSRAILGHVVQQRRTFYQVVASDTTTDSLAGISAVVASPVLDDEDRVVGAVYGARFSRPTGLSAIRPLEAQVVQVLAAAVGAGLARLQSEAEATRRLVQFEQFFTPDLARELDRDPDLLEGRERELTVLFSDIRGFSRLSERIGPRETCRLVGDVMERLTTCIRRFDGVVVDYIGDGLMAMWNAPADQPDHPVLACRAALAMLAELPGINDCWRDEAGTMLGLGIGLNTGPALVGNTGSRYKFKYGPLGHTVNLASRVEGATRHLGVSALITGATHEKLGDSLATRRLGRVRVHGIDNVVDLYELHAEVAPPDWVAYRDAFESALSHYEEGRWRDACLTLYPLLGGGVEGVYDVPSLSLAGRAIECLKAPPNPFDPVLELDRK